MVKWSGTWARSEALSSFPSLSVQQAMQSWVGPGNDASGNIHLTELYCAVLSWASAHGCSQLNQQKLGGAVTQRRCLNGLTVPTQTPQMRS